MHLPDEPLIHKVYNTRMGMDVHLLKALGSFLKLLLSFPRSYLISNKVSYFCITIYTDIFRYKFPDATNDLHLCFLFLQFYTA